MALEQDLAIRGESVQRVYQYYLNETFLVNRRYQRKLVWTIDEKRKFIDSLVQGFPVPIILLADVEYNSKKKYEIIDGMQRLNAVSAFIENEFDINGEYFDLETIVETKNLLDSKNLEQKTPVLNREDCSKIASYSMPLSIYTISDKDKIDDIFKRVNAFGKHLSKQELRVAGSVSNFASLVRKISSEIRGDASQSDILLLNNMKEISITNVKLGYGILVDKIFWVENYILTKEMVRDSKDEEVISDIIANIIFPNRQGTNTESRDALYGFRESDLTTKLEDGIVKIGADNLHAQIIKVYDLIREVLVHSGKNFRDLISLNSNAQRLPRYFTIIFLAFHELLFQENKEVSDLDGLIKKLHQISRHISITTGGNWSSKNIEFNVNAVAGIIRKCFKNSGQANPASQKWITEFETILMQSRVENVLYDFKQGLLTLNSPPVLNMNVIADSIKTLIAICNTVKNSTGYICIGVADKKSDADRIVSLFNISPIKFRNYNITGLSHEATFLKIDMDKYFRMVIDYIRKLPIDDPTKRDICGSIKLISYKSMDVLMITLKSDKEPRLYDDEFYVREGANVAQIPKNAIAPFIRNYLEG